MSRFSDPEESGRPPEDLGAWLAAGMRRTEALAWRKWNFDLAEAKQWRAVGVQEALIAAQWQVAGVVPGAVADWIKARITVGEAIRWHEFGFNLDQAREHTKAGRTPDDAYNQGNRSTPLAKYMPRTFAAAAGAPVERIQKFLNSGVPHNVMSSYLQLQWTDEQAISWAKNGIQAWDAKLWLTIGLVADEAADLLKDNKKPADVIKEWWRAGIPYDEVADWIGAGLTSEEAVAQRESGVTVEQAAALRALRRGGGL